MATKSPTQFHNYWGTFSVPADLPNVAGAPTQDAALQAGDAACTLNRTWLCTTATVGAAVWVPVGGGTVLGFGSANLRVVTAERFMDPWAFDGLALAAEAAYTLPRSGTLRNFYYRQNTPGTGGNQITTVVKINNVATALSITMSATGTQGSNLVNQVAVVAGDRIAVSQTKDVAMATNSVDIVAVVELF